MNEKRALPHSWVVCELNEVTSDVSYGYTAKSSERKIGPKMLRITDIQNNRVDWHTVPFCEIPESLKPKYLLHEGDLVFARTGATVGKSFLISGDIPESVYASYLIRVRTASKDISDYLGYFFRTPDYWDQITDLSSGIGQPNVNGKKLKSLKIPIAPLSEQTRIAKRINTLLQKSNKARTALDAIPPLLEKFRQSVLSSAFRGDLTADWRAQTPDIESAEKLLEHIRKERRKRWEEDELAKMKAKGKTPKGDKWKDKYKEPEPVDTSDLPELPGGWCWAAFEELYFNAQNGISKRNSSLGSLTNVLRLADIENGRISDFNSRQIKLTELEIEQYQLKHQDIICIRVNGSKDLVARLVLFDSDTLWTFCDHFIRFRLLLDYVEAGFIVPLFNSEAARNYIQIHMVSSAGQNTISQASLRRLPIPLPPREEQKIISLTIETYDDFVGKIEAIVAKESKRVSTLDQSILAKAFRGELVPQDLNDESASQLLERIKLEKASHETGKKKRARRGRTAKRL